MSFWGLPSNNPNGDFSMREYHRQMQQRGSEERRRRHLAQRRRQTQLPPAPPPPPPTRRHSISNRAAVQNRQTRRARQQQQREEQLALAYRPHPRYRGDNQNGNQGSSGGPGGESLWKPPSSPDPYSSFGLGPAPGPGLDMITEILHEYPDHRRRWETGMTAKEDMEETGQSHMPGQGDTPQQDTSTYSTTQAVQMAGVTACLLGELHMGGSEAKTEAEARPEGRSTSSPN